MKKKSQTVKRLEAQYKFYTLLDRIRVGNRLPSALKKDMALDAINLYYKGWPKAKGWAKSMAGQTKVSIGIATVK